MDKTGLELQQLKGKLGKRHILTFGFALTVVLNLFFFKSRGRDLSRPF